MDRRFVCVGELAKPVSSPTPISERGLKHRQRYCCRARAHTIAKKYMFEDFMKNTAKSLLVNISELAPHISSRAAEIEAGRRVPPESLSADA
jgi:hypothetical protein